MDLHTNTLTVSNVFASHWTSAVDREPGAYRVYQEVPVTAMRFVAIFMCSLAYTPLMAMRQHDLGVSGRWSVDGTPKSDDFKGAALGSDITIDNAAGRISIQYSMGRKRTWTLDGVETRTPVRVADAGSYTETGSARIDNARIVLVTGRDRGGHISREERIIYREGDMLIVKATAWIDSKVTSSSTLSYRRAAPGN